jgi:hypothetical protein
MSGWYCFRLSSTALAPDRYPSAIIQCFFVRMLENDAAYFSQQVFHVFQHLRFAVLAWCFDQGNALIIITFTEHANVAKPRARPSPLAHLFRVAQKMAYLFGNGNSWLLRPSDPDDHALK